MKEVMIGKSTAANDAIGGIPKFYYYDFQSRGRGEVIRLFFEEAQIGFQDIRYSFEEHNGMSEEERKRQNPVGSVPIVELNGKTLTQSYPILRYLSGLLGKYDGKTAEERYFVDVICDLAADWRTKFVDSAFVTSKDGLNANEDKKPFEHHKGFLMPKFVKGIEGQLASSPYSKSGPFSIGENITYADLVVWQIYHDEREIGGKINEELAKAPHLKALLEAVGKTTNIAAYHASERYYN